MVTPCLSIYSIVVNFSLDYLLRTFIFCALALQACTVFQTSEFAAYAIASNLANAQISPQCNVKECWSLSRIEEDQNVTRLQINSRQALGIRATARSLSFYQENIETTTRTPSPKLEWSFEGMLELDGSISCVKLMVEDNQYRPPDRDQSAPNSNRTGTSIPGQHPANQLASFDTKYRPCPESLRDLIPCSNISGHLYGHCPNISRGQGQCVISTPALYSRQFKWPASKDQVRRPNIPNVPLWKDQQQQKWITSSGKGNVIKFGDGEPKFPYGTSKYFDDLSLMIPELSFGKSTRLVLDVGCSTGNVAAALERRKVLTLSIAGEGSKDNGVQVVLERGYPALVQSIFSHRLPYPSQAFDLVHCAACDIQWVQNGGLKLLEADRIVRAGGFFIWMDPSEGRANWRGMEELTKAICWTHVAKWGRFSLWQKPTNQTCYLSRKTPTPPLCDKSYSPDTSWNVPLQSCLVGFQETYGAITHPWPNRLEKPPKRLDHVPAAGIEAAKPEVYQADLNYWMYIVAFYTANYGPNRVRDIHNVLDMNAGYGGFAAAVSLTKTLQWWVLNVVPVDLPDRLAVIFDRGLIGIYHDWCESLDAYPRTFDMVHSSGVFSSLLRCHMSDIIQEMDRLLRPGGFAVIRDQEFVLLKVQIIAKALHWKVKMEDTESGPKGKDKVLSCQKNFWRPKVGKTGGDWLKISKQPPL